MPSLSAYMTASALPASGLFVGRAWNPAADGPSIVRRDGERLIDITAAFPTMRDLCEANDPAAAARAVTGPSLARLRRSSPTRRPKRATPQNRGFWHPPTCRR